MTAIERLKAYKEREVLTYDWLMENLNSVPNKAHLPYHTIYRWLKTNRIRPVYETDLKERLDYLEQKTV